MTTQEILTIWEKEWTIGYASKIRFLAPPGSISKWTRRNDVLPHNHAIQVEGPGTVLQAVAQQLKMRKTKGNPSSTKASTAEPDKQARSAFHHRIPLEETKFRNMEEKAKMNMLYRGNKWMKIKKWKKLRGHTQRGILWLEQEKGGIAWIGIH